MSPNALGQARRTETAGDTERRNPALPAPIGWEFALSFVKPATSWTYQLTLAYQRKEQEPSAKKHYPIKDAALLRGPVLPIFTICTKLVHTEAQLYN